MFIPRSEHDVLVTKAQMVELSNKKLVKENKQLREQLEDQQAKHNREVDKRNLNHDVAIERLQRKLDHATEEISVHEKAIVDRDELTSKAMTLGSRERILAAREADFDNFTKELTKAGKRAEETREEGFKKGYADGVADGLREASKITAEDRKMAMQVALVSAASHTPEAATELVKEMGQKVLSSGLGNSDKPAQKSKG